MFSAEFTAIGTIWESVLKQGAFFFQNYIADINDYHVKWYMFFFSAVLVYGFVQIFFRRKRH